MRIFKHLMLALIVLTFTTSAWAGTPKKLKYGARFSDEGADHATPPSGYLDLYVNSDALYVIDDSGNKTDVIATTSQTAWDDLAVPDANESLDMTDYYTEWDFGDTDHDMFTMWFTGAFGNVSGVLLEQKTGNATDGTVLELKLADTDVDFVSMATSGTEVVNIDSSGNLTLASGSASAITKAANGAADDFSFTLTGAQNSSLVLSSAGTAADALTISTSAGGMDITVAGAAAGEDLDLTSAASINLVATETAADQIKIDAQGTVAGNALNLETSDGGIIVNAVGASNGDLTLQAGDNMALTATGTVAIDSADWDISAQGSVTNIASLGFDSATVVYHDTVEISNAEIKDLNGAPKTLVSAPGANKFLELVSVVLILDYGSNVLTESADNLVVEYATSGMDATGTIECTGFIDQAVDQMAFIPAATIATDAASDIVNNAFRLFNPNDNFAGNAGADTTMTVKIAYRIHADGL